MKYYLVSGSDSSSDSGYWEIIIIARDKRQAASLAKKELRNRKYSHLIDDMKVELVVVQENVSTVIRSSGLNGAKS
jgi:hypothetical protein